MNTLTKYSPFCFLFTFLHYNSMGKAGEYVPLDALKRESISTKSNRNMGIKKIIPSHTNFNIVQKQVFSGKTAII